MNRFLTVMGVLVWMFIIVWAIAAYYQNSNTPDEEYLPRALIQGGVNTSVVVNCTVINGVSLLSVVDEVDYYQPKSNRDFMKMGCFSAFSTDTNILSGDRVTIKLVEWYGLNGFTPKIDRIAVKIHPK